MHTPAYINIYTNIYLYSGQSRQISREQTVECRKPVLGSISGLKILPSPSLWGFASSPQGP